MLISRAGTAHMLSPQTVGQHVTEALECGYRFLDFSTMYETMRFAAPALRAWIDEGQGRREEVYVSVKGGDGTVGPKDWNMRKWVEQALQEVCQTHNSRVTGEEQG